MTPAWHAKGLLFENCSCQLVCPGHLHFSQACTHERCVGYWAIRVDEGTFGDVSLAGTRAFIAFDAPQHMIDGGWTEVVIIDESATAEQRAALDTVLTGKAGGPWAVLARFVAQWQPTRYVPIRFDEADGGFEAAVGDIGTSRVSPIRGRDRTQPVTFENIFNQIHASHQVLAVGSTAYDDGVIAIATSKTHGLHSRFAWASD